MGLCFPMHVCFARLQLGPAPLNVLFGLAQDIESKNVAELECQKQRAEKRRRALVKLQDHFR